MTRIDTWSFCTRDEWLVEVLGARLVGSKSKEYSAGAYCRLITFGWQNGVNEERAKRDIVGFRISPGTCSVADRWDLTMSKSRDLSRWIAGVVDPTILVAVSGRGVGLVQPSIARWRLG